MRDEGGETVREVLGLVRKLLILRNTNSCI